MEIRPEDSILDSETFDTDVSAVIDLYPEIKDAMSFAGNRCACGCHGTSYTLKGGCLQTFMYAQVVLLIGHAMAESSGATTVSHVNSGLSSEALIESTTRFLDNLSSQGLIFWGDWFRLACTAISGLPGDLGIRTPSDDAGELLCWVAGSMSIVPAWFALDEDIKLGGSWSIKSLVGCPLGVLAEKAIVKPQLTNPTSSVIPPPTRQVNNDTVIGNGNEVPIVESAILSSSGTSYRLMTLVKTS